MNTATLNAVTLSGPAAAVANIPAMLGFTPSESVVAVWLKDGSVLVTQRADIIPALDSPTEFITPVLKHEPDEVILMFWTDRIGITSGVTSKFIEYANSVSHVRDALWVTNGRWGSLVCDDSECCPPAGREIDPCLKAQELGDPAGTRADLTPECRPGGVTLMKPLDPHGIEGWRDKQIDRLMQAYTEGGFESEKHVVRAGRALHDVRVRDTILWQATTMLDLSEYRAAYDLAASVARAMHPSDAAPACTIAGILAWIAGDGARANVALEYALRSDPGYSLALLLEAALMTAMPPSSWVESMEALSFDDVRKPVKA